jgi:uncharacterized circularly permuted ATP-grasp superfamily protein
MIASTSAKSRMLSNVPTYMLRKAEDLAYVLEHLPNWWSRKSTARAATACWSARPRPREQIAEVPRNDTGGPDNYIAQPTLALSTCPTFVESGVVAAPRRPAALRALGQGASPSCPAA